MLLLVWRKIDASVSLAKMSNHHVNASGSIEGEKNWGSSDSDAIQKSSVIRLGESSMRERSGFTGNNRSTPVDRTTAGSIEMVSGRRRHRWMNDVVHFRAGIIQYKVVFFPRALSRADTQGSWQEICHAAACRALFHGTTASSSPHSYSVEVYKWLYS